MTTLCRCLQGVCICGVSLSLRSGSVEGTYKGVVPSLRRFGHLQEWPPPAFSSFPPPLPPSFIKSTPFPVSLCRCREQDFFLKVRARACGFDCASKKCVCPDCARQADVLQRCRRGLHIAQPPPSPRGVFYRLALLCFTNTAV